MIDVRPLKLIAGRMEDSPAKKLILYLADDVSREDLLGKFDLILQFLGTERQGVAKNE